MKLNYIPEHVHPYITTDEDIVDITNAIYTDKDTDMHTGFIIFERNREGTRTDIRLRSQQTHTLTH